MVILQFIPFAVPIVNFYCLISIALPNNMPVVF